MVEVECLSPGSITLAMIHASLNFLLFYITMLSVGKGLLLLVQWEHLLISVKHFSKYQFSLWFLEKKSSK